MSPLLRAAVSSPLTRSSMASRSLSRCLSALRSSVNSLTAVVSSNFIRRLAASCSCSPAAYASWWARCRHTLASNSAQLLARSRCITAEPSSSPCSFTTAPPAAYPAPSCQSSILGYLPQSEYRSISWSRASTVFIKVTHSTRSLVRSSAWRRATLAMCSLA